MIELFGRDAELRELEKQCDAIRSSRYGSDEHNRRPPAVVLLKGPSGCGKTTLAQELGRRINLRAEEEAEARSRSRHGSGGSGESGKQGLASRCEEGEVQAAAPPQSGEYEGPLPLAAWVEQRERNLVFISGKVDQFQRHLPFAVILRALDELGKFLLVPVEKMRAGTSIYRSPRRRERQQQSRLHEPRNRFPLDTGLKAIRSVLRHEGRTLVQMVPSLTQFMEFMERSQQYPEDSPLSSSSVVSWSDASSRLNRHVSQRVLTGTGENSAELSLLPQSETMSHHCHPKNEVVTERLVCLAVQAFVRVFVKRINPIVWFVDDLQWADDSSVRLLQALVVDPQLAHVLLILGYRPAEDTVPGHPHGGPGLAPAPCGTDLALRTELDRLWRCIHSRVDVELGNLPLDVACAPWLAHMLNCDENKARPLAEFLHRKTDGNPYFILNFLELLQRKQHLRFRYQTQKWDWSMNEILEAESPPSMGGGSSRYHHHHRPSQTACNMHSVEEMVKMQIVSLPLLVQQLLQVASCLGFYFDEPLLKGLLQTCDSLLLMGFAHVTALANLTYDEEDVSEGINPQSEENDEEGNEAYLQALYQAEEVGLIRPTRDPGVYQFSHDRVQQIVSGSCVSIIFAPETRVLSL
jgi:predicted ATPase